MSNWFVRTLLRFISPQAAVIGIIHAKGKILLTRRSSHIIEGGKWCLPGGRLDKNETAVEGVMREIREETRLKTKSARFLFYHDEFVPSLHLHGLVLVFDVHTSGTPRPNWEVSEWRWFTFAEAMKLDMAFRHKDIVRRVRKFL